RATLVIPSLLKRYAHTIRVNRPEFLGPPRLGLQRTVGMHLAAPLLVFDVQCFNTLHGQTHHGLVADLPCQDFVVHASDVEVRLAAVDPCISWRGRVAKSFLEAADLGPPLQRFRGVGSRQNRDRAFNDRAFNGHDWLHRQTANQPISNCKCKDKALPSNTVCHSTSEWLVEGRASSPVHTAREDAPSRHWLSAETKDLGCRFPLTR